LTILENLDDPSTCLKLKRALDSVIVSSHDTIINKKEQFIEILERYSLWTYSTNEIQMIFEAFCERPEQYALTGFLQLSAILEFSLGNVYQTKFNQHPPHLLKDLLKELRACNLFYGNQVSMLITLNPQNCSLINFFLDFYPSDPSWHFKRSKSEKCHMAWISGNH